MTESDWRPSHRQLVSAVISLALPGDSVVPPLLYEVGYRLQSIELEMTDREGRPYSVDVHVLREDINLSVLIDCKTYADNLKPEQLERYLATVGANVVTGAGLSLSEPSSHRAGVAFVVLPPVEAPLMEVVRGFVVRCDGWGIVLAAELLLRLSHDELSDSDLSASLGAGWAVDLASAPLERLPYEADAPDWELGDAVFRTIIGIFAAGEVSFTVDDVCSQSNDLWPFLYTEQAHLRERVRKQVRSIRGTALKGYLVAVRGGSTHEDRWRFDRSSTTKATVLAALRRRHSRYVEILMNRGEPRPRNFDDLDAEQLVLPLPLPNGPWSD